MEKKKFLFETPETVKIGYKGQEIELVPYIGGELELRLVNEYVDLYFNSKEVKTVDMFKFDYLRAECMLKVLIMDKLTNIDMTDQDFMELTHIGLWDKIQEGIENYDEFYYGTLLSVVRGIERQLENDKALGSVIDGIVVRLSDFMEKLSVLNPDDMKSIVAEASGLLKGIEESPAAGLFKEAAQAKEEK
jgi:hypothetical protein